MNEYGWLGNAAGSEIVSSSRFWGPPQPRGRLNSIKGGRVLFSLTIRFPRFASNTPIGDSSIMLLPPFHFPLPTPDLILLLCLHGWRIA